MADTLRRQWTIEEFLAWEERQEVRHELVDGFVRSMVGATRRHSRIAGNVGAHLREQLKGGKCESYVADMRVVSAAGNVRYPDVTVDCGPMKGDDLAATEPTVVVEVLSKSTAFLDQTHKLNDYQSIPSMRHVLHLVQERAEAELWSRGDGGWTRHSLMGLEAVVELSALRVSLPLRAAYEKVEFDPEPAPHNDNGEA